MHSFKSTSRFYKDIQPLSFKSALLLILQTLLSKPACTAENNKAGINNQTKINQQLPLFKEDQIRPSESLTEQDLALTC